MEGLYRDLDEAGIRWTLNTGIYVTDSNKEVVVPIFAKYKLNVILRDWCEYCKSYEVTIEKIK